jgi:hypothetical protein
MNRAVDNLWTTRPNLCSIPVDNSYVLDSLVYAEAYKSQEKL